MIGFPSDLIIHTDLIKNMLEPKKTQINFVGMQNCKIVIFLLSYLTVINSRECGVDTIKPISNAPYFLGAESFICFSTGVI